jgi:hypothetical protein
MSEKNSNENQSVIEPSTVASAGAGSTVTTQDVSPVSVAAAPDVSAQPRSSNHEAMESDDDLDPITYEKISPERRVFIKGSNSKQAFDRKSIEAWFDQRRKEGKPLTHPMTNEVVSGELEGGELSPSPAPSAATSPVATAKSKEEVKFALSAASSPSSEKQINPVVEQSTTRPAARSSSSFGAPRWIEENLLANLNYILESVINKNGPVYVPVAVEKLRDLIGQDISKIQQIDNGEFCHEDLKHIKFHLIDDTDKNGQVILQFKSHNDAKEFFSYLENKKNGVQKDIGTLQLAEAFVNEIKNLIGEKNHTQEQSSSPVLKK